MNVPYVKQYNDKKELLNPITKDNPYLTNGPTTSQQNREFKRPRNNKKGIRLIVTNIGKGQFVKTIVKQQIIPEGISKKEPGRMTPRRVITHYHGLNLN